MNADEAPDTGDDSDDDLITSYIGNTASGEGISAASGVPSISVTAANGNRILGEARRALSHIIIGKKGKNVTLYTYTRSFSQRTTCNSWPKFTKTSRE